MKTMTEYTKDTIEGGQTIIEGYRDIGRTGEDIDGLGLPAPCRWRIIIDWAI